MAIAVVLAGCGGGGVPGAPPAPDLVDGRGVYTLRYNPPPCLADRPDVVAELQTELGWERVSLEDESPDAPVLATLQARFAGAASELVHVRADVTDDTRPYGAGHVARVVRLTAVVTVPEP